MKNILKLSAIALATTLLTSHAYADGDSMENIYFDKHKTAELTDTEKKALRDVEKYQTNTSSQATFTNKNGAVVYTFGAQVPSVVCAVMQVCDIELEDGENINGVNIGDSTRWSVEPTVSGSGANSKQHVLIKPLDVGLQTSMLIATDRRVYHLNLKSTHTKYMPYVSFQYPEKLKAQFEAQQAKIKQERDRNSISTGNLGVGSTTSSKTYLGDLNFNYKVEGDVSWKPVRVFDDGKKTIIEMPEEMQYRTAPSLMLLVDKGGWFTDEVTEIVNYRLQGTRYVVDRLFDTAILTMDLDKHQQRVVITRQKKK